MKFSEQWLRELVNVEVSTEVLAEQMTLAGLEIDAIEPVASDFSKVVIGEVLTVDKHPDADKLSICQVNVGESDPLQIVCGASNVKPEMKVPAALIGAKLGDLKIKKGKLRGVESYGMLCSATELGIAESADGLYELPHDATVGEDIRTYLCLDDQSIDMELTPNRGDCLSLSGIAREVAVLNNVECSQVTVDSVQADINDSFEVSLESPEACPHYVGRVIRNIQLAMPTPLWMQERLRRSGIRSIDPVVDVTNYVMLELGQPVHAFDLETLQGKIIVRQAQAGEQLQLLDESELSLTIKDCLITDESGPLALAGVMGGLHSSVSEKTQHIFLESAYFKPELIALTGQRHNTHSDSSHRFERGVDFNLQVKAIERATALLLDIVGGDAGPIIEETHSPAMPEVPVINVRHHRIERVLGISISHDEVERIYRQLGMQVERSSDGWRVTPPSYRFDIQREVDLVEEVGRIYGYDRIPYGGAVLNQSMRGLSEQQVPETMIRQLMVERDYAEAITYSFVDETIQQHISPDLEAIRLINPISQEMNVMRTSLWPGLLQAALYNLKRQQARVRLFELGLCFTKQGDELKQEPWIAGLITGTAQPEQWGDSSQAADFYDVKADVEALLSLAGLPMSCYEWQKTKHPALHPGQGADILIEGKIIGHVGTIHPGIKQKLNIKQTILLFSLKMQAIDHTEVPKFATLSRYPAIRRDIALIVDESVSVASIEAVIRQQAMSWLKGLVVFDVYRGDNLANGQKSIAIGLLLQHQERTLQDGEVNDLMEQVLSALKQNTGAILRE